MDDEQPMMSGREAAELYRRDRQAAEARGNGFEDLGREPFLQWLKDNRETMIELAIRRGMSRQDAEIAVSDHAEAIRQQQNVTAFDDPSAVVILESLINEVEKACRAANTPIGEGVVFGTLPQLGISASQQSVMGTGASIIAISTAFVPFCSQASKLMTSMLPHRSVNGDLWRVSCDPHEVSKNLDSSAALKAAWAWFITMYACTGWPPRPRLKFDLSGIVGTTQIQILMAMERFAVAHEYGHHVLGHGRATSTAHQKDGYIQEFEADLFARSVGFAIDDGPIPNTYTLSGAGAVMILGLLDLIHRARAVLVTGSDKVEPYDSHPPYQERIAALGKADEFMPPQDRPALADQRACFVEIIEMIWRTIKPAFDDMHVDGIRPLARGNDQGGWLPGSW